MLGKKTEKGHQQDKDIASIEVATQLDQIPLNWGKMPEVNNIMRIIQLCLGPYSP